MALPTSYRGTLVYAVVVILGVSSYFAYIYGGVVLLGLVYWAGLILSLWGMSGNASKPLPQVAVKTVFAFYIIFMLARVLESYFMRSWPIYVLEKLWGLGLVALVTGGRLALFLRSGLFVLERILLIALFLIVMVFTLNRCGESLDFELIVVFLTPFLVVNSLFEEGMFRGLMLRSLSHRLGSINLGIVLQALLFSFWHIPHIIWTPSIWAIGYLIASLAAGLSLGFVSAKEGSIATAVILHTLWNLSAIIGCADIVPEALLLWLAPFVLYHPLWGKIFRKQDSKV